jgi:hypothetical protein
MHLSLSPTKLEQELAPDSIKKLAQNLPDNPNQALGIHLDLMSMGGCAIGHVYTNSKDVGIA